MRYIRAVKIVLNTGSWYSSVVLCSSELPSLLLIYLLTTAFLPACDLPIFARSAVMGMVSARREVLRFVGMGAVQKSPPRSVLC